MSSGSGVRLENFTHGFAKWAGSSKGFVAALSSLVLWLGAGEFYGFSTGWENALTIYISVITFLMIFLMQRAQNKELLAVHAKLNELIAATQHADNSLINADHLSEREILEVTENHRMLGRSEKTTG